MAVTNFASFVALEAVDAVREFVDDINTVLAEELSADAGTLVFEPRTLAGEILDVIDGIDDLELLRSISETGLSLPDVDVTTANRRQQSVNQTALIELIRGGAAVSWPNEYPKPPSQTEPARLQHVIKSGIP